MVYVTVYLPYSQKRKSEDLNGEDTNGQNEVKKEEDDVEQVKKNSTSVIVQFIIRK